MRHYTRPSVIQGTVDPTIQMFIGLVIPPHMLFFCDEECREMTRLYFTIHDWAWTHTYK